MRVAVIVGLLASPSQAEPPITASEFAAHVGNDTIVYQYTDEVGIADYGPNGSLVWRRKEDFCVAGHWRQEGDALCFYFANSEESHCWHFFLRGGKLEAVGTERDHTRIREVSRSDHPLDCAEVQI